MHGLAIPDETEERAAAFRSLLANRRMLIVADDAASSRQVRALLPGTAGPAAIVTSRTQLTDLEGARLLPLAPLPHAEAISLLARIVGPQRVDAEPETASQLVTSCGRLPLAVRIVGARLAARPSWPVALLAGRLASQHRLDELQTTGLSVRASLTLSHLALEELPQRAYRLIGLLGPADFAEWVIAALLGIPDATDVINDLANCSLLTPSGPDATGQPRYRLHDLLRDYAVERLADEPAGERDAAISRVLDAWLQFAAVADSRLPNGPYFPRPDHHDLPRVLPEGTVEQVTRDAVAWFSAERTNALTAIELACSTHALPKATRLAVLLASYQHFQSRVDDTEQAWRAVLNAACQAGDVATDAQAELRLVINLCVGARTLMPCPSCEVAQNHSPSSPISGIWPSHCTGLRYVNSIWVSSPGAAVPLVRRWNWPGSYPIARPNSLRCGSWPCCRLACPTADGRPCARLRRRWPSPANWMSQAGS
jgi:NB-ARC domain